VRQNAQHRSVLSVVSTTSIPLFQPHHPQSAIKVFVGRPSPGFKVNVQEVPIVVLEFSPGLLGPYGVWYCHDEAVLILPFGLDVFCELHSEGSTEFHSTMVNSHFHHAAENGLTVFPESPKIWQA
jgi:hypothetical protein